MVSVTRVLFGEPPRDSPAGRACRGRTERRELELPTNFETDRANRRTAIIVGALFLISYAGVFIGSAVTGGVVDSDYLLNAFPDRAQLTMGTLIELVNDLAVIGIAVLLYPFLRKASEGVALFYVGLRILEGAFFMVAKVSTLALVDVSEDYLAAGTAEAASYERMGELALAMRDAANVIATISFIIGGIALYYLLLRSELVPRFISIWGFVAIASLIAANVFGVPDLTQTFEPAMLLYLLIVANELFLAGWLIVKGFNAPAIESEPPVPSQRELTYT